MDSKANVLRSSNVPNKYELIIVAAKEARRLTGSSGQNEQRVGARIERVRGQHGDRQRNLAAFRLGAVLGNFERAALR